jgi:hypothetical protein
MLMRVLTGVAVALASSPTAAASSACRVLPAHGVRLAVPTGWERVLSAGDGPTIDPKTLLVVGTSGVHPRSSQCQVAAYSIPPAGAVVVIVGWKTATSGGGDLKPGRAPLASVRSVRRPSFECFNRRGAVAQVALGGKAYPSATGPAHESSRRHSLLGGRSTSCIDAPNQGSRSAERARRGGNLTARELDQLARLGDHRPRLGRGNGPAAITAEVE